MGQQQLLLLVLGIVIVGLATVFGVFVFQEQSRRHTGDDLLSRNVTIAQEAVNWRGRSSVHGGGGGGNFNPLADDGFVKLGMSASVATGDFAIVSANGQVLEVVGVSRRFPDVGAYVRLSGDDIDSTAVRYDGTIELPGAP